MGWFCVLSKEKPECIVSGNNVLEALNKHHNVIKFYIGRRAKDIRLSIDETQKERLGEYAISVKYSLYKPSGKKEGDYETVLWVDSIPEPKAP